MPAPIDPLQPPTIHLEVTACSAIDPPVALFGSAAAGGWTGGLLTERVGACDPGPDGRCAFSDLAAGRWVLRQGEVVRGLWLKGGPGAWRREVALPCDHSCAVDLVVDADPACGERGTLRLLPPRPLPADAQPDPRADLTWTAGSSQRIDPFPCGTVTVALASAGCRQVHTLPDPEGAPLRALRLRLAPVDRITLRQSSRASAPGPAAAPRSKRWSVVGVC